MDDVMKNEFPQKILFSTTTFSIRDRKQLRSFTMSALGMLVNTSTMRTIRASLLLWEVGLESLSAMPRT